jgi:LAO/AO transport system kinase
MARLLRAVDDELPGVEDELRALFPRTGRAHIVGVTGTPGAGKSTLCDRLIAAWRAKGRTVGVLAIDPTSPFTGGAILGDRIRMQEHALDTGVFIRSLATRGNLGGLSRATFDSVKVLDAMGFDHILIETVGVGQDEVEIASLAHTTLVVTVPGLGDDVQAIKAGILEIADIFVVNKADREGADRTVRDLRGLLDLRRSHPVEGQPEPWEPPIVSCVAVENVGVGELASAIDRHWRELVDSGGRTRRESARAKAELLNRLAGRLIPRAVAALEAGEGPLDAVAASIARREQNLYDVVDRSLARIGLGAA